MAERPDDVVEQEEEAQEDAKPLENGKSPAKAKRKAKAKAKGGGNVYKAKAAAMLEGKDVEEALAEGKRAVEEATAKLEAAMNSQSGEDKEAESYKAVVLAAQKEVESLVEGETEAYEAVKQAQTVLQTEEQACEEMKKEQAENRKAIEYIEAEINNLTKISDMAEAKLAAKAAASAVKATADEQRRIAKDQERKVQEALKKVSLEDEPEEEEQELLEAKVSERIRTKQAKKAVAAEMAVFDKMRAERIKQREMQARAVGVAKAKAKGKKRSAESPAQKGTPKKGRVIGDID